MRLKASLMALALITSASASTSAMAEISVVQTPSAALARGSTYAWAPISGVAYGAPAPAIVNEITAQRMARETDAVLTEKGYRQVANPSEADLIVVYRLAVGTDLDVAVDERAAPCGPICTGGAANSVKATRKAQGTLVLDLYDRRTGHLVYRAASEKRISSKDASSERLNAVLKRMTKSLPL